MQELDFLPLGTALALQNAVQSLCLLNIRYSPDPSLSYGSTTYPKCLATAYFLSR